MSTIDIFAKGTFFPVTNSFWQHGLVTLQGISDFQNAFAGFAGYDTDTTINAIRDSLVAHRLGYDLLNTEKHGFDAKNSKHGTFLEIKQCSMFTKHWVGTWNDTSVDKALAFCDPRLFTAVAVWKGANDLLFIVYGQSALLGQYLHQRVVNRKQDSRSVQKVTIQKLMSWGFEVVVPFGGNKATITNHILTYRKKANIVFSAL